MVGMEEMGEFLNGKGLRREAEQGTDDDFHTRCVLLNPILFSDAFTCLCPVPGKYKSV